MSLTTVADKVVVITGAGSGIGRALAVRAAHGGALLALSDWNAEGLAETVRLVEHAGATATGDFADLSYDDLDWIVGVNFYGVVHGSKEFLPHLIASGDGALVNISSLFGLVSAPGQSAYNATKYAVRGLTESLREEMLVAGHPVTVTCVHPGGIKTAIARNARV